MGRKRKNEPSTTHVRILKTDKLKVEKLCLKYGERASSKILNDIFEGRISIEELTNL